MSEVVPPGNPGFTTDTEGKRASGPSRDIASLGEVEVTATVELGRANLPIRDVLKFHRGSVIELDKLTGQPVDLLVNNTLMAKGEVIVINGRFGFRITKFVQPNKP